MPNTSNQIALPATAEIWGSGGDQRPGRTPNIAHEYALTRGDMHMARQAIAGGAPISPEMIAYLTNAADTQMRDESLPVRARQNAAKLILMLAEYNLRVYSKLSDRVKQMENIQAGEQPNVVINVDARADAGRVAAVRAIIAGRAGRERPADDIGR